MTILNDKKIAAAALAISAIFLFRPLFALAEQDKRLNLGKTPAHFAREMEFYYKNPRPEIARDLLASFARGGLLADGEKRLFTAAFLAELAAAGRIDLKKLADESAPLGRDARLTVVWSARLAKSPDEKKIAAKLLDESEAPFAAQIAAAPAPLSQWRLESGRIVPQMFLAAYMASGDPAWLDRLLDAALLYGRLNGAGETRDPDYAGGQAAAALLYEYGRRHPEIARRIAARRAPEGSAESQTLKELQGQSAR